MDTQLGGEHQKIVCYVITTITSYFSDFLTRLTRDSLGLKMVGLCFGHQILAGALGGKVEKNPAGWEVKRRRFFV